MRPPALALAAGLLQGLLLVSPAVPSAVAQTAPPDERGLVLVRRDCRSEIDRQEITLFANGTVRLRSGPPGEETMALGELPPDEVEAFVGGLRQEDLTSDDVGSAGPEGAWVEACVVELPVLVAGSDAALAVPASAPPVGGGPEATGREPGRREPPPAVLRYRRFDSLSLAVARVVAEIDALATRVDTAPGRRGLPPGYRPRPGDVLRRSDGVLFRVVRTTAELAGSAARGWELQGVTQPLAIYIAEGDLPREFVELISRDDASPF